MQINKNEMSHVVLSTWLMCYSSAIKYIKVAAAASTTIRVITGSIISPPFIV